MKKINKILLSIAVITAMYYFQSCTSENPYLTPGEGALHIQTELRGDVTINTRSSAVYDEATLNNNLVMYIENSKGVIRKYFGKQTIPEVISLPTGEYVAEAWTGDSVSADHEKKFYRAYRPFTIGEGSNELSLSVNIANVIVSINPESLNTGIENLNIKINHTRGSLDFDSEKINKGVKGYYMMPNSDKNLYYEITGITEDGSEFTKEGEIENVQRAHEYVLTLTAETPEIEQGGALIKISIEDIPVLDEKVEVLPAPTFRAFIGNDIYDIANNQLIKPDDGFKDVRLRVLTYKGLNNLTLEFNEAFTGVDDISGKNIANSSELEALLANKGIEYIQQSYNNAVQDGNGNEMSAVETYLTFTQEFLNNLSDSNIPYKIVISAIDGRFFSGSITFNIANTEAAIEKPDPVTSASSPDPEKEPMAILATSATLTGYVNLDEVDDYGIKYRIQGTENYTEARPTRSTTNIGTRAQSAFTVALSGLTPGKTYEYKTFWKDKNGQSKEEQTAKTFTTEDKFIIPNASMEEWSTNRDILKNKDVPIPNANGIRSFWDTGNHGSMSMGKAITESSTLMHGNGTQSACLVSQFIGVVGIGKFAAGNLFIGSYVRTDGTDGVLSLGREYNNSHPSAMNLLVNYRPKKVEISGKEPLKEGDMDEGQIYIALSTKPVEIRTKTSDQKLFNANDPEIVAYGEYTFSENYGDENTLKPLSIEFKYKKDRAEKNKPLYIIMVCSASKYGDYFVGGEKSTMYLDDFELEYGELQFE